MSDSRLIHLLTETQKMLTNNRKFVSLKRLEEVTQQLILEGEDSNGNVVNKLKELQHASDISQYEQGQQLNRQMVDACVNLGGIALKTAILINGGASVAMLAYLGKLPVDADYGAFPFAMLLFVMGVLLSAIATGTGYLAQYSWTQHHDKRGNLILIVTVLLLISSYFCFGSGGYQAFLEFTK